MRYRQVAKSNCNLESDSSSPTLQVVNCPIAGTESKSPVLWTVHIVGCSCTFPIPISRQANKVTSPQNGRLDDDNNCNCNNDEKLPFFLQSSSCIFGNCKPQKCLYVCPLPSHSVSLSVNLQPRTDTWAQPSKKTKKQNKKKRKARQHYATLNKSPLWSFASKREINSSISHTPQALEWLWAGRGDSPKYRGVLFYITCKLKSPRACCCVVN